MIFRTSYSMKVVTHEIAHGMTTNIIQLTVGNHYIIIAQ